MNNGNKDFFMAYSADLTPAAGEFHTPPCLINPFWHDGVGKNRKHFQYKLRKYLK